MAFKRAVSILLSVTMTLTLGVPPTPASAAREARDRDVIGVLIQALLTDDLAASEAFLTQAKEMLRDEQLPDENMYRITLLLDRAAKRIKDRNSEGQQPAPSYAGYDDNHINQLMTLYKNVGPSALKQADLDTVGKLLNEHPEVRATMWEVSQGRLAKDTQNLAEVVGKEKLEAHTQHENQIRQSHTELGSVTSLLEGVIRADKWTAQNQALLERLDPMPIGEIADSIIRSATIKSGGAGAARRLVYKAQQHLGLLTGKLGITGGAVAESGITFVNNANLTLRLANLYGLQLSEADEESLLLVILALSKVAAQYGLQSFITQNAIDTTSKSFAQLGQSSNPSARTQIARSLLQSKLMTGVLNKAGIKVEAVDDSKSDKNKSDTSSGTTDASPDKKAEADKNGERTEGQDTDKKQNRRRLSPALLVAEALTLSFSPMETYAVGMTAKLFADRTRQAERQLGNNSFRSELMNAYGEGFIKLLILSMGNSKYLTKTINLENPVDPKVMFILNIARSARICSPSDLQKWKAIEKSNDIHLNIQERILQYACDTNLNQDRYERIREEFFTFNSIPHEYIANLRLAKKESRLRMAELLLQMQFLDRDLDPRELLHFRETASAILGLNSLEDQRYFDRMASFIVNKGGMIADPMSPTGFTIANMSAQNPYDLSSGYMATNGPGLAEYGRTPSKSEKTGTK